MTFYTWLKDQKGRTDAVGEFAKVIFDDITSNKPRGRSGYTTWRKWLLSLGYTERTLKDLADAYEEWRRATAEPELD